MLLTKLSRFQLKAVACSVVLGLTCSLPAHANNNTNTVADISSASTASGAASQEVSTKPMTPQQSRTDIQATLPSGYTPIYLNALADIYAQRDMHLVWQDAALTKAFEVQLADVAMAGVQPQFIRWVDQLTRTDLTPLARDIILSDAMLGYMSYVAGVPSEGEKWLYGQTASIFSAPSRKAIGQWINAFNDGAGATFIASLAPQSPQYEPLQKALIAQLDDAKPWPQLRSTTTLRPGEISDDVPALRDILTRLGLLSENKAEDSQQSANIYNPALVDAVKHFQREYALESDGAIGLQTRRLLNISPAQRAAIIALNIQRLRLIPGKVDDGIMVNIPDYSLVYYLNGKEALSSRVIVGRVDRKTPIMSSRLNNVVLNPPWNVPVSLARKDILPKLRRDPSYAERGGYTIFNGWSNDAEQVDPYQVDWSTITEKNLPFRFQQKPGPHNSLGFYKFNIPNNDAIYLHDTPSRHLFSRQQRALSSGCVRVNKASELANMLLKNVGWNNTRIGDVLKDGNTRYVPVKQHIPVRLYYLTAFAEPNGQVAVRTDIYGYDSNALKNADNVTKAKLLLQ